MKLDRTRDEEENLLAGAGRPTAMGQGQGEHDGPSLTCDEAGDDNSDDESPFGCPCCMVPWFR